MSKTRPPLWFWVISVLLLLWNLMGLMAFFMDGLMSGEAMAQLPIEHQQLYLDRPIWVVIAFGAAVATGTAGCIALLLRRKLATGLFAASIVSVLIQDTWFLFGGVIEAVGTEAIIMPILVIASLVAALLLSLRATQKSWST